MSDTFDHYGDAYYSNLEDNIFDDTVHVDVEPAQKNKVRNQKHNKQQTPPAICKCGHDYCFYMNKEDRTCKTDKRCYHKHQAGA